MKRRLVLLLIILASAGQAARCERIKDIVDIQGVRGNPLYGIGLVMGLQNSGDSSLPSRQMLANIFRAAGLVFRPEDLSGKNVAVVMVTAELGPFDRIGARIDVDVSSIGDAKSLQGGMLLATPLKGLDGQVYAVVQSGVSVGGWTAAGDQASITKNHQTVARVPGGAIVEREEIADFVEILAGRRFVTFDLRNADFSTAENISTAVNTIHPDVAEVIDAGTIRVLIPDQIADSEIAAFIDEISQPDVKVDMPAVVTINEKTGTIVVGENVSISPVAISQGSLVVNIKETASVSQPVAPFSDSGTTEVIPDTIIGVEEKEGYLIPVPHVVTVSELATALNAIGATPTDLIAIFNALKKAGALQAKLEIM
jgi:flagellar P-ring protein precursor FlgI